MASRPESQDGKQIMTEQGDGETTDEASHDGETLTASRAYQLKEEQGLSYREIGNLYGKSKDTARRRYKEFEKGVETGKNEAGPNDFSVEELRQAISDKQDDDNPFEYECPGCGAPIAEGEEVCDNCDAEIEWS